MTLQSRSPRVCIVSVYRWEKCTSTTICRFQMLFQFGWYFFFCCILFTTWVSVSVSIYLFTATSHSVKASPLLLCICLEDARWTWSIFSGTYLLLVAERFIGRLDDISVLSLLFHWVIFGFPERHASICSRSTSTPCLCHSLSNGRKTREFGGWPGLENEKGFQWTISNLGMKSELMCRSTRDLTCIICTWWWNSLYSYCFKCCNLMVKTVL